MFRSKGLKLLLVGLMLVAMSGMVVGCASVEPYAYKHEADSEMTGPGLLTGEAGEKVIFSIKDEPKQQPKTD